MPAEDVIDPRDLARMDEDAPQAWNADLPPEIASPLAPFNGAVPERPAWFDWALSQKPEERFIEVDGVPIELLTWGEIGKPGLLLLHGNSAHAHWWNGIAPFLANDFRIAAVSLSGMGASGWRERYTFDHYANELDAAAHAGGLHADGRKPIYAGHSFGGSVVYYAGSRRPDKMRGCLLIDTGFGGPPTDAEIAEWEAKAKAEGRPFQMPQRRQRMSGPHRVYPSLEKALTRFRLMPPQVPGTLYTTDDIARHSLKRAPLPDGGEGWTWCFDPDTWDRLDRVPMAETRMGPDMPVAHIYGDRSEIIRMHAQTGRGKDMLPAQTKQIIIPDSGHHIMIDQPLALVAAMRALLAVWPG